MSTQLEKTTQRDSKNDLRSLIQSDAIKDQLLAALPSYFTPEQFAVVVRTALNKNPKLQECSPESFLVSVLTAAQMGLRCDGRQGHLIARWNGKKNCMECTFQPDYKGFVDLVRRNDNVADVYADLVCENDVFKIIKGLHRDLVHEIDIRKERGKVLGAYAVVQYKDTSPSFDFMQIHEIEAIRERSDGYKAFKAGKASSSTWVTDFGEMAKKTVIRRLLKLADLSPDTHDRISHDVETTVTRVDGPKIEAPQIERPGQAALKDVVHTAADENTGDHQDAGGKVVKAEDAATTTQAGTTKAEKTTKRKLTKPAAAVEVEKEQQEASPENDLVAKIGSALAETNMDIPDLIRVAIKNRWCEPCDPNTTPLSTLGDEKLTLFIEDIETVREEIMAMRNEQAAQ